MHLLKLQEIFFFIRFSKKILHGLYVKFISDRSMYCTYCMQWKFKLSYDFDKTHLMSCHASPYKAFGLINQMETRGDL